MLSSKCKNVQNRELLIESAIYHAKHYLHISKRIDVFRHVLISFPDMTFKEFGDRWHYLNELSII